MQPELIQGGSHSDPRGTLRFNNNFGMSAVQRFYVVEPVDTATVRAWQGHQQEQKWFYVLEGSFLVACVAPDDWKEPSANLPVQTFRLQKSSEQILHIPAGYANGFRALEALSRLMVFSDSSLEASLKDDYRFEQSLWFNFEK